MDENKKLLFKHDEAWDAEKLHLIWAEIEEIAKELEISYYPPQFEVISAEQMIDAYTSVAMPVMYRHWSFGKAFIQQNHDYQEGRMGLAYEVVINSNPAIAYLMESNSITMMALVMAHASVGHSAVFKNNYLFKTWTDAGGIIDYLVYAKNYIKKCEERYGDEAVERVLDAAHSIQQYGVDKYKRKTRNKSSAKKAQREIERHQQKIDDFDDLWDKTVPKAEFVYDLDDDHPGQLEEPEENLLYFIEKQAPTLPTWKREIIRIVRRLATYWYPQGRTQVVNEGYATFTHHYIMNRLYERGLIDEGSFIEFIANHTGVITQYDYDNKYYSGFNVYTVGFNIFRDLKRMCENPTDEDREWFPDIVGKKWQDVINTAMKNYDNETFINQFLSPKVMRDMKLFAVLDSYREKDYVVSGIHDEQGYRTVREIFARQYNRSRHIPDITVVAADLNGSRELVLFHNDINDVPLDERSATQVLQYVAELWEYDVRLETISLNSRGPANKDIVVKGPNSEISKLRVSPRDPYFSPETD